MAALLREAELRNQQSRIAALGCDRSQMQLYAARFTSKLAGQRLYLIERHWTLFHRQIIHKSLQIKIQ